MNLIETTETQYRFEGGVTLPRVTSILSLVHRFDGIPLDVLQHAAERGKAVHRGCWLLCGGAGSPIHWPSVHPEVVPYLEAFQKFLAASRCKVLDKERLVTSKLYGYAGRLDLLVQDGKRLRVLDLKTGEAHPSHHLQVAAYCEAAREIYIRRPYRWVLYLRGDGTYRLDDCEQTNQDADFKVFTALVTAYRWSQAHGGNNGH